MPKIFVSQFSNEEEDFVQVPSGFRGQEDYFVKANSYISWKEANEYFQTRSYNNDWVNPPSVPTDNIESKEFDISVEYGEIADPRGVCGGTVGDKKLLWIVDAQSLCVYAFNRETGVREDGFDFDLFSDTNDPTQSNTNPTDIFCDGTYIYVSDISRDDDTNSPNRIFRYTISTISSNTATSNIINVNNGTNSEPGELAGIWKRADNEWYFSFKNNASDRNKEVAEPFPEMRIYQVKTTSSTDLSLETPVDITMSSYPYRFTGEGTPTLNYKGLTGDAKAGILWLPSNISAPNDDTGSRGETQLGAFSFKKMFADGSGSTFETPSKIGFWKSYFENTENTDANGYILDNKGFRFDSPNITRSKPSFSGSSFNILTTEETPIHAGLETGLWALPIHIPSETGTVVLKFGGENLKIESGFSGWVYVNNTSASSEGIKIIAVSTAVNGVKWNAPIEITLNPEKGRAVKDKPINVETVPSLGFGDLGNELNNNVTGLYKDTAAQLMYVVDGGNNTGSDITIANTKLFVYNTKTKQRENGRDRIVRDFQENALITASKLIDASYEFPGRKVYGRQQLEFPRYNWRRRTSRDGGSYGIGNQLYDHYGIWEYGAGGKVPRVLRDAVCETAMIILRSDFLKDAVNVGDRHIQSMSASSVSITFSEFPRDVQWIPKHVQSALRADGCRDISRPGMVKQLR